jgi:hypothetical protein
MGWRAQPITGRCARNSAGVTKPTSAMVGFTTHGKERWFPVEGYLHAGTSLPGNRGVTATVRNIGTLDIPAYWLHHAVLFRSQTWLPGPGQCIRSGTFDTLNVGDSLDVTYHLRI